MWRSVPQIDATFTLTSTSVRPKAGIFTSRTSAPGAASGLTTAIIVPAIIATYEFDAKNAANTKRMILAPSDARGWRQTGVTAGLVLRRDSLELFRLSPWDAQRLPFARAEVFCQEYDLPDVLGIVSDLAVDGLEDSVRLAADRHSVHHVFGLERIDGGGDTRPSFLPPLHHICAGG